jgi:outer membrane protein assembly factor BamB
VALISGIFCGLVALLLILNFWHMKQHEPLESKTIEILMNRLAAEPNNEELKEEIRSFDLLARKAYFTSRWQVRTGTWLLLFGGILMAASLKVYTDLRARIEEPEKVTEELLRARANSQYWLLVAGGLILGFSLVAGWLSNDYLTEYQAMGVAEETAQPQDGVEVIEVFPTIQPADSAAGDSALVQEAEGGTDGTEALAVTEDRTEQWPADHSAGPDHSRPGIDALQSRRFQDQPGQFQGVHGARDLLPQKHPGQLERFHRPKHQMEGGFLQARLQYAGDLGR